MTICFCGRKAESGDFICYGCKLQLLDYIKDKLRINEFNLLEFLEDIKTNGMGEVGKCPYCCGYYIFGGCDLSQYEGVETPCCIRCYKDVEMAQMEKEIGDYK